jgi:hypothetical protein
MLRSIIKLIKNLREFFFQNIVTQNNGCGQIRESEGSAMGAHISARDNSGNALT